MDRCRWTLLGIVLLALPGHVGSYDAWFLGEAGPYGVEVVIRAPGVIPGLAEILVRTGDASVTRVTAATAYWQSGAEGLPPADVAEPVPGDPGSWSTRLWFMNPGSHRVHVTVHGDQGEGEAIIPFDAVATTMKAMDPILGWTLAGLGLFLVVGLVSIVGAAVREGSLPPGEPLPPGRGRRVWLARVVATGCIALLLMGGKRWWDAEDSLYSGRVYAPGGMELTLRDGLTLDILLSEEAGGIRFASPIVPDHGRLMHFFVVGSGSTTLAHLHPIRNEEGVFTTRLPPLPPGSYRAYGEVLHASGFGRTAVGLIQVPEGGGEGEWAPDDVEDAWLPPGREAPDGLRAPLGDGTTLVWERGAGPIRAGEPAPLRFTVRDGSGAIVPVEPYLGMAGHGVVEREDGEVFVHLHPSGSTSMGAEMLHRARALAEGTVDVDGLRGAVGSGSGSSEPMDHGGHGGAMIPGEGGGTGDLVFPGEIRFPWGFPSPGRYRIWVQVRRGGELLSGAFITVVE